ncbi:hypothetical protein JW921_01450 [Candidatus Fermentibacterales bacterium]|nr:hypothetical protein [Candidatus Fermentibacterales bacterium]
MMVELLLIVAFGGSLLTYVLGKLSSRLRNGFALLNALALVIMIGMLYGQEFERSLPFGFLGIQFSIRMNMLSWFFAATILGIGLLAVLYSFRYMKGKERLDYYYFTLLFINASMLGTVVAGDLLSFFIFWEMMSWSTYLLISLRGGGKAIFAGIKYIIMSLVGSLAMLVAIVSLYTAFGTVDIGELAVHMQSASLGLALLVVILFSITFVIINALWPFHTWLPDAHAEAVSPFSAILSAVLVRKGLYGLFLLMYVILGFSFLDRLAVGAISFSNVLAWIGAITIVFAAFRALLQNDSKRILAWSTVGQGGYMVLGVSVATSMGMAGGTFHILNHCIYIALLFFVAGAIEHRTGGIRDLDSLGGLIKKMPVAFVGGLVGIFGLIGLPLTNGFVSKWLIYKSLILEGRPFLAFAAFLGTWGTILYGYKFIHNIFLGQLPDELRDVKRVPFTMAVPIMVLVVLVFLFGVLPGIPLSVVNQVGTYMGFEPLDLNVWGIPSESGTLNVVNLLAAIAVAGFLVWLLFKTLGRSTRVDQSDNYAAGAAIPRGRYGFTREFYAPLYRIVSPYVKDFPDALFLWIADRTKALGGMTRKIYSGYVGSYVMYIVLFLAALVFVQLTWSPW